MQYFARIRGEPRASLEPILRPFNIFVRDHYPRASSPNEFNGKRALVPTTVLTDLAEDVGTDAATRFVRVFVELWPTRRQRIHAAIRSRDADAVVDAVLSLRSGALMAGAQPLAEQADLIHKLLLTPEFPAWESARHLVLALDELGDRTVETLSGAVARWS